MDTRGIRISDMKDNKCVPLIDILETIQNGDNLNWSILWSDVTPIPGEGEFVIDLENKTNKSEIGFNLNFEQLKLFSKKIFQEIDLTIIGCKNKSNLHRYKQDQEMYETCDVVIEMIDGGYWEIFSKDLNLIVRLKTKFNETKLLEPDFEK